MAILLGALFSHMYGNIMFRALILILQYNILIILQIYDIAIVYC